MSNVYPTLNEYIKHLQDFVEKNPGAGERIAVTSIDDEGNGYKGVWLDDPDLCRFDGENRGEILTDEDIGEFGYTREEAAEAFPILAVRI